jgi:hypothetical protein
MEKALLGGNYSLDQLLYLSKTRSEYKMFINILKKYQFHTIRQSLLETNPKGYDSEDPNHYSDIALYNEPIISSSATYKKKSAIKPIK